ncbi:MAG: hypothetical protein PVI06_06940 [Desulfobacterales bacterium]
MKNHQAIFLEEPPTPEFKKMLHGDLAIDDYLISIDMEYPEFSRRMCDLLRDLLQSGKKIFQVEPFLENLLAIHTLFARGYGPEDLNQNPVQYRVYHAERDATGALLAYYQTAMTGSFDDTINAVQRFARLDAARFRLRDSLRVQALTPLVRNYASSYIEAGEIHYELWRMLRKSIAQEFHVKPVFLADAALKMLGINGHFYGPGDRLTLLYVFHPYIYGTGRERLLAARALIYTKLIEKEELTDDTQSFPHLRNELACLQTVNRLSLDNCRNLFFRLRRANTTEARQVVGDYLREYKDIPRPAPESL